MKQTKPTKYTINYTKRDMLEVEKKRYILKWVEENHPEVIRKCNKRIEEFLEYEKNNKK